MRKDRQILFILAVMLTSASLSAFALERGMHQSRQLIEAGDTDQALEILQELRVDHPDRQEPRFGIGCVWFQKGEHFLENGAVQDAAKAYEEARTVFDDLLHDENPAISREAHFNRANCLARAALLFDPAMDYDGAVAALRRSVAAYESGLERYPDHEHMRQNHAHMRYRLKQLLQQPPEEQEQPDQPPPDQEPPPVYSLFGRVATELPGASAVHEDNTAILVMPKKENAEP